MTSFEEGHLSVETELIYADFKVTYLYLPSIYSYLCTSSAIKVIKLEINQAAAGDLIYLPERGRH